MTENKKKLRQQHNLRQVFELCGSLRLPFHVALSPVGSGQIIEDKRFGSCRASSKFPFGKFRLSAKRCVQLNAIVKELKFLMMFLNIYLKLTINRIDFMK